jgi:hypothetical protein
VILPDDCFVRIERHIGHFSLFKFLAWDAAEETHQARENVTGHSTDETPDCQDGGQNPLNDHQEKILNPPFSHKAFRCHSVPLLISIRRRKARPTMAGNIARRPVIEPPPARRQQGAVLTLQRGGPAYVSARLAGNKQGAKKHAPSSPAKARCLPARRTAVTARAPPPLFASSKKQPLADEQRASL